MPPHKGEAPVKTNVRAFIKREDVIDICSPLVGQCAIERLRLTPVPETAGANALQRGSQLRKQKVCGNGTLVGSDSFCRVPIY